MKKSILVITLAAFILINIFSLTTYAFANEKASFSVIYNDLEIPFKIFSVFVLPKEKIKISIAKQDQNSNYRIKLGSKIYQSSTSFSWRAQAESGHYQVRLNKKNNYSKKDEILINVFVLTPYSKKEGEYFKNFRIGNYPQIPAAKKDSYSNPKGFLKIEKSMLDLNLTPHFKLRQFVTNQSQSFPQFIVIKEKLLLKLEYFLEEVNRAGYQADTFGIVSAYRSPYFNKKIGNKTALSRHIYGDAADIYIDNQVNSLMDDLNHDGQSDLKDAKILYDLALAFDQKEKFKALQGGLSCYAANGVRGPFIHIDTRGFHVSW
ncbi:MAG: D-Ala-D-Ala carboxypeptidase family metallohydrolase [Bacillota bacterium]